MSHTLTSACEGRKRGGEGGGEEREEKEREEREEKEREREEEREKEKGKEGRRGEGEGVKEPWHWITACKRESTWAGTRITDETCFPLSASSAMVISSQACVCVWAHYM